MTQKLEINPVTGKLELAELNEVKWGDVQGDINDQTDLINLIVANTPTLQEVTDVANVTSNNLIVTKPFVGSSNITGGIITNIQSGSNTASLLDSSKLSVENLANNFKTNLIFPISTQENTITLKNSSGTIAFLTDITGTNSGINTGDETTLSIQTKRPLKTIEGQSLEGSGDIILNHTRSLFTQNTTVTTANVTTETDLLTAYSIPANLLIERDTIRISLNGLYSRGGGSSTFRVYLGTTLIAYTASINSSNNTNASMNGYVDIIFRTVGLTGSVMVGGNINLESTIFGLRNAQISGISSLTATTINTTVNQQIRITHQFSNTNANNSLKTLTANILLIK